MNQQLVLEVSGMSCGGCEQRISTALGRLEGVRRCSADHRSGRVRVAYDPAAVTAHALRERVTEMGYAVTPSAGER